MIVKCSNFTPLFLYFQMIVIMIIDKLIKLIILLIILMICGFVAGILFLTISAPSLKKQILTILLLFLYVLLLVITNFFLFKKFIQPTYNFTSHVLIIIWTILFVINFIFYKCYDKFITKYHIFKRNEEMCSSGPLEKETVLYQFMNYYLINKPLRGLIMTFILLIFALIVYASTNEFFKYNRNYGLLFILFIAFCMTFVFVGFILSPKNSTNLSQSYQNELNILGPWLNDSLNDSKHTEKMRFFKEALINRIQSDYQYERSNDAASKLINLLKNEEGGLDVGGYIRMKTDGTRLIDLINDFIGLEKDTTKITYLENVKKVLTNIKDKNFNIHDDIKKIKKTYSKYFICIFVILGYFVFHILYQQNLGILTSWILFVLFMFVTYTMAMLVDV